MKIAVTAKGKELGSDIDPRFGRCGFFVIVDTETMEFESIINESAMASGGAGPQAAQTISRTGAKVLITGNVGPNAHQALEAAGMEIITGSNGTVGDMIEKYKNGELSSTTAPTVGSHAGMR
ncbi:MAG: NifB/NifX family molybdenum-iron cluster-binding protein [Candidatus Thermoplasmatota archaeon]|nr:NifB/NifX family molybdenum-iron cluster-binding protein [Candidatus Thermoplasmatota archaeon]